MTNTVNGFMLIDTPHSALNNAGSDAGERTENIVRVKKIRKGRDVYPYISGQALRYWWRDTLADMYNWNLSPIVREKKIAFTGADPINYDDDDIFGYMRALKKNQGGTVTRSSVLKNSPLMSVTSEVPTSDYGVMARHEGDPVPYEHELYSSVMRGIFSINLDEVGVFYKSEKSGYRNVYPDLEETAKQSGAVEHEDKWVMPEDIRIKRATEPIKVLPYLNGGAKQSAHLTDVSPKFLILAAIEGGNHLFMNITKDNNGEPLVNLKALDDVISDYYDVIQTNIYIGKRSGFMDELEDGIQELVNKYNNSDKKIIYQSINDTVEAFTQEIPGLME